MKIEWLCWNCERWNVGKIVIPRYQPKIREGEPKVLHGKCVNCDEKSEILIAVSSGKLPEDK